MAIARRDSVTVSIAALRSGTLTRMFRVTRDETSTALGSTCECRGTSSTSSKVSAVRQADRNLIGVEDVGSCFHEPGSSPEPYAPWHFLYFLPLPHGHGSLRPTFGSSRLTCFTTSSPPVRAGRGAAWPAAFPRMAPNGDGGGADCGELSVICCGGRRGCVGRIGDVGAGGIVAGDRREAPQVADDFFFDAILHRLKSAKLSFLYSTSGSRWP